MCWLVHNWGIWSRPYMVGHMGNKLDGENPADFYGKWNQRRACSSCGKVEDRVACTPEYKANDDYSFRDDLTEGHPW
jgi:hypothetical protein